MLRIYAIFSSRLKPVTDLILGPCGSTVQSTFGFFFLFPWESCLFLILFLSASVRIERQWTHLIFVLTMPVFSVSKLLWPSVRKSTLSFTDLLFLPCLKNVWLFVLMSSATSFSFATFLFLSYFFFYTSSFLCPLTKTLP